MKQIFSIFIFLLIFPAMLLADFQQGYNYSIKLHLQHDYYRSITEILRLEFKYREKVNQSDLKVYLLKNLFYLQQYDELINQANSILGSRNTYPEEIIKETSQILTVSLLKKNRPDNAFQTWSGYSNGEGISDFPRPANMDDLINPNTAGWFSAVIPGSGFLLTENYGKATTSFILNAIFIAGCVNYYQKKQYGIAGLMLFFEIGWYQGGIKASMEYANKYNRSLIEAREKSWIRKYTQY